MCCALDQTSHWSPEVCEKGGQKAGYKGVGGVQNLF